MMTRCKKVVVKDFIAILFWSSVVAYFWIFGAVNFERALLAKKSKNHIPQRGGNSYVILPYLLSFNVHDVFGIDFLASIHESIQRMASLLCLPSNDPLDPSIKKTKESNGTQ